MLTIVIITTLTRAYTTCKKGSEAGVTNTRKTSEELIFESYREHGYIVVI